jgi:RNA polymerase sigma-70 factor, ECF subfamily
MEKFDDLFGNTGMRQPVVGSVNSTASYTRTDKELLARHVAGDREAFGCLYERHHDKLRRAARSIVGEHLAYDALHEGMIKAHQRAAQFRGEAAVSTWLYRIVKNAALDLARRRARRPEVSTDLEAASLPGIPPHRLDWQETQTVALKVLTREQWQAILLVDVMCYPVADAAETLGVAEGTVKSRARRGRMALAEKLAA